MNIYKNVYADVMTLEHFKNHVVWPVYNNIYIDVDRFLNTEELEILYEKLAVQNLKQTFIHLG